MKKMEQQERSGSTGLAARTALAAGQVCGNDVINECFVAGNDKKNDGADCGYVLSFVQDCLMNRCNS